jgi:hypothetical protein
MPSVTDSRLPDAAQALLLPLLLPLLLAGCTLPPQLPPADTAPAPAPVAAPAPAVAASAPEKPRAPVAVAEPAPHPLSSWQEKLKQMPPAELQREIAQREASTDALVALEAALALVQQRALAQAQGQPANGELARALALVEPHTRTGAAAEWKPYAKLLQARLAEQRRLEDQLAQLQQQLQQQQRRNEQLAAQIEALRAIERSLSGAGQRPPAPSSPPSSPPAR